MIDKQNMTTEIKEEFNKIMDGLRAFCITNEVPIFMLYGDDTVTDGKVSQVDYGHLVITPFEVGKEYKNDKILKYSASLNKNFDLRLKETIDMSQLMEDAFDSFMAEI